MAWKLCDLGLSFWKTFQKRASDGVKTALMVRELKGSNAFAASGYAPGSIARGTCMSCTGPDQLPSHAALSRSYTAQGIWCGYQSRARGVAVEGIPAINRNANGRRRS